MHITNFGFTMNNLHLMNYEIHFDTVIKQILFTHDTEYLETLALWLERYCVGVCAGAGRVRASECTEGLCRCGLQNRVADCRI